MKSFVKYSLLTTSLAVGCMSAHADGYGFYALLDASIANTQISGAGASVGKTEFVTGGYAPNFAGVTGEKSLGGGYSAGFKLEQGFLLNQPASGNSRFAFGDDSLFNRQANLYITGSQGTVRLGTQPNIAFGSVLKGDARDGSNYGSSLAAIVINGGLGTVDNSAISYSSPAFSGFTAAATYVPETATLNAASRIQAGYDAKSFSATVAAYSNDVKGDSTLSTGYVLGGSYKIDAFTLKALGVKQKNPTYSELSTYGFGGTYALTPATLLDAGVFKTTDSKTNYSMSTIGVGVRYNFLKDLTVYAQYASVKNDGTTTTAFNFAPPTILTGNITAGQTASTFNVGLLYGFF